MAAFILDYLYIVMDGCVYCRRKRSRPREVKLESESSEITLQVLVRWLLRYAAHVIIEVYD